MEASLRATVRFDVITAEALAEFGVVTGPLAETADYLVPTGLSEDLDEAVENCVRAAIELLHARYGMDRDLAYAYLSAATDFDISQVVDLVKGVHARIRKADFDELTTSHPLRATPTVPPTVCSTPSTPTRARWWPTTCRRSTRLRGLAGDAARRRDRAAGRARGDHGLPAPSGRRAEAADRRRHVRVLGEDGRGRRVLAPVAAGAAQQTQLWRRSARRAGGSRRPGAARRPSSTRASGAWSARRSSPGGGHPDPLVGRTRRREGPVRRRRVSRSGPACPPTWRTAILRPSTPRPCRPCSTPAPRCSASRRPTSSRTASPARNSPYGTPPNARRARARSPAARRAAPPRPWRSATRRSGSAPTRAGRSGCPRRTRGSGGCGPRTAASPRATWCRSRRRSTPSAGSPGDRARAAGGSRVSGVVAPRGAPRPSRFVVDPRLLASVDAAVRDAFDARWTARLRRRRTRSPSATSPACTRCSASSRPPRRGRRTARGSTAHPGGSLGRDVEARFHFGARRSRRSRGRRPGSSCRRSASSSTGCSRRGSCCSSARVDRAAVDRRPPPRSTGCAPHTLGLTCIAGVRGAPALSAPLLAVPDGAPLGALPRRPARLRPRARRSGGGARRPDDRAADAPAPRNNPQRVETGVA